MEKGIETSLEKRLEKNFQKRPNKIWNRDFECCTFASALKSRAKKSREEVERLRKKGEKNLQKVLQKRG
jgi:hypothetical protein